MLVRVLVAAVHEHYRDAVRRQLFTVSTVSIGSSTEISERRSSQCGGMHMCVPSTLFDDIDSMDPDRFAAHLAEGAAMRFGNAPPIEGRQACRDTWAEFCEGIDGVSHSRVGQWRSDAGTVVESDVSYDRKDGRSVTVPVVTIYREGRRADRRLPGLHRPRAAVRRVASRDPQCRRTCPSASATRLTWPSVIAGKNGSASERSATSSQTGNSPGRWP